MIRTVYRVVSYNIRTGKTQQKDFHNEQLAHCYRFELLRNGSNAKVIPIQRGEK